MTRQRMHGIATDHRSPAFPLFQLRASAEVRPIIDLEKWLERPSLIKANRDLLKLLRSLSAEASQPNSGEAAARAYFQIHLEIDDLISRKLRAERTRARSHGPSKRERRETDDHLVRLVRIKAYELGIGRPRQSREQAEQLALQDFTLNEPGCRVIWKESDLSPVERRALAILGGAQRISKKNVLEERAIKLALAVIAEWFRPRRRPGRRAGSKIRLSRNTTIADPKLVSVAEAIETILPTIEQLAGPATSSSPRSTMIKVVASAVRSSTGLICTLDLAASVVQKLRRRGPPTP
jgi:hypothetical protein